MTRAVDNFADTCRGHSRTPRTLVSAIQAPNTTESNQKPFIGLTYVNAPWLNTLRGGQVSAKCPRVSATTSNLWITPPY